VWRLLLDQNIRYEVKEKLIDLKFDVEHATDLRLQTAPYPEILNHAIKAERVLLTLDTDFGDLNIFPLPSSHPGVIRIQTKQPIPAIILQILRDFIEKHPQQYV